MKKLVVLISVVVLAALIGGSIVLAQDGEEVTLEDVEAASGRSSLTRR